MHRKLLATTHGRGLLQQTIHSHSSSSGNESNGETVQKVCDKHGECSTFITKCHNGQCESFETSGAGDMRAVTLPAQPAAGTQAPVTVHSEHSSSSSGFSASAGLLYFVVLPLVIMALFYLLLRLWRKRQQSRPPVYRTMRETSGDGPGNDSSAFPLQGGVKL